MPSCGNGLAAVVLAVATTATAQPADQTALFKEAAAREATLRREMTATRPPAATTVRRVRTLVGAYDDLARIFPASGQADKALWQGATLSADVFWQIGEAQDRETALRMLAALTAGFPTSSYAHHVAELEKRLRAAPVTVSTPAPPDAAPAQSPPAAPRVTDTKPAVTPTRSAAVPPPPPPTQPRAPLSPAPAASARSAPAPDTAAGVSLRAVRREVLPEAARITLELDREVAYRTERIHGPDRVFIDLPQTQPVATLKAAVLPFPDDVVRRVRIGVQPNRVTRVVLDLEGSGRHSVYTLYNPYRIVIDVERTAGTRAPAATSPATRNAAPSKPGPATPTAPPPASPVALAPAPAPAAVPTSAPIPLSATTAPSEPAPAVAALPAGVADIVASPAPGAPAPDTARPAKPPAPPAVNARGGFSLSRQLGLGVARIVIDAGHGGHDPGAKVKGLNEADLTLDVALRLEKLLTKLPGVEVVQTRRTNSFVALEERTEIANRAGADLFLSIHANASSDARARGVETYYLNFAPNAEAEAIAARENAGANRQMRQLPDIVKAIALNNKIDESRDLATIVQGALFNGVRKTDRRVRNLGVKQAPFMVLVGASMPSILTEISFVTNEQEAGLLATEKYRQQIAEALLAGITRYQQSLKKATVATQ